MTKLRLALSAFTLLAAPTAAHAAAPASDVTIADRDIFPESLDSDASGRLYIGSVKGNVYRTAPNGNSAETWIRPDAQNGLMSILGVLVDAPKHTLWVCTTPMPFKQPAQTGTPSIVAFDLATGKFKARYPLPTPATACNDMSVAPDGTLFVSETPAGRILTLAPRAKELQVFASDPALKGIDGLAFAGDGTLYINNISASTMARVKRDAQGGYAGLAPLELSIPLKGPDGLRLLKGNTFLEAESGMGRVTLLTIEGDKASFKVLRDGLMSSPGVTAARGRAYAVEGKIGYLIDPKLKGQDPNPFLARAIPLDGAQ